MQDRGQLRVWGAWNPRYTGGAGLARETENRALAISVGPEENPQLSLAGGCGLRERS